MRSKIVAYSFILIAVVFTQSVASVGYAADSPPDLCHGDDINRFRLPIYPDRNGSPMFELSARYRKSSSPEFPTVVFFAGGPGQSGIAMMESSTVPQAFGALFIDPRGIGCSDADNPVFSRESFSGEYLSQDAITVIKQLGLRNIILYGHSYGTILATMVASKLQKDRSIPVTAVVLEGVLGRTYRPGEWLKQFEGQWEWVRSQLSDRARLRIQNEPDLLGFSPAVWGEYIVQSLYIGVVPGYGSLLLQNLKALETDDQQKMEALTSDITRNTGGGGIQGTADLMYRQITCSEVSPDAPEFVFQMGELRGKSICSSDTAAMPFKASDWPIVSIPIYYFAGERDPATPSWQAHLHYQQQPGSPRVLVEVNDAGHNVLWRLKDCTSEIWSLISRRQTDISASLGHCKNNTSLRISR